MTSSICGEVTKYWARAVVVLTSTFVLDLLRDPDHSFHRNVTGFLGACQLFSVVDALQASRREGVRCQSARLFDHPWQLVRAAFGHLTDPVDEGRAAAERAVDRGGLVGVEGGFGDGRVVEELPGLVGAPGGSGPHFDNIDDGDANQRLFWPLAPGSRMWRLLSESRCQALDQRNCAWSASYYHYVEVLLFSHAFFPNLGFACHIFALHRVTVRRKQVG